MFCKHCGKECKNENSHRNHERLCPKNDNRVYKSHSKSKPSWNKGLTKEEIIEAEKAYKAIPGNESKVNVPDKAYLISNRAPILMLHIIHMSLRLDRLWLIVNLILVQLKDLLEKIDL